MKARNNKSIIILIVVSLTIIALVIGMTYAYFATDITGNETASNININAGNLIIDFQTSQYIDNFTGELIKSSEKETKADTSVFTVRHNTSSVDYATYILSLTNISISDNLKSADFKWELLKNNSVINRGTFQNIGSATTLPLTSSTQTLEKTQTDNYILRLWLEETDADQSSLYNGTFTAKITLNAVSS